MKKRIILFAVLGILIIFLIFLRPTVSAAKVLLLASEEFPQIPIKPLGVLTKQPEKESVVITYQDKKILGDLFVPKSTQKKPAIIVAMGVKTSDKDKPTLLGFCESLARLGYVVLWPRLENLEKDITKFEDPQTFIDAFGFLEKQDYVDKSRISFVGFSVGSSLALVAAENETINDNVQSVVFFGGYYNILDYLSTLSRKTIGLDSQTIKWLPAESAIDHAQKILEKEGLTLDLFDKKIPIDSSLTKRLSRFSPDENIDFLKAKIFILHEKSDTFVPYTESIKLKQALEQKGESLVYHQANLFDHVQPRKGRSYEMVNEFFGLFVFLHKVFMYL